MCSNRCAKPGRPFGSMRKPIRYITSTTTTGAAWFSLTTTRRPLGSFRYATGTEKAEPAAAGAVDDCADRAAEDDVARAARQTAITELRMARDCSIRGLDDSGRLKDCDT